MVRKHSTKNYFNFYEIPSKTRIAFENLTERLNSGQSEGEAANNTGIEYTQAAEVNLSDCRHLKE